VAEYTGTTMMRRWFFCPLPQGSERRFDALILHQVPIGKMDYISFDPNHFELGKYKNKFHNSKIEDGYLLLRYGQDNSTTMTEAVDPLLPFPNNASFAFQ